MTPKQKLNPAELREKIELREKLNLSQEESERAREYVIAVRALVEIRYNTGLKKVAAFKCFTELFGGLAPEIDKIFPDSVRISAQVFNGAYHERLRQKKLVKLAYVS